MKFSIEWNPIVRYISYKRYITLKAMNCSNGNKYYVTNVDNILWGYVFVKSKIFQFLVKKHVEETAIPRMPFK